MLQEALLDVEKYNFQQGKVVQNAQKYNQTVKRANTIHYFNPYCHSDFPFCLGSREQYKTFKQIVLYPDLNNSLKTIIFVIYPTDS